MGEAAIAHLEKRFTGLVIGLLLKAEQVPEVRDRMIGR